MWKKVTALLLTLLLFGEAFLATSPLNAQPGPIIFKKSKYLQRDAQGERDMVRTDILIFEDRIEIRRHDRPDIVKSLEYSKIRAAQYSYSKSPRWKSGAGAAVAVGVFAIPLFFLKGKKHWLTFQEEGDYAVVKLDKRIHRELIVAFESKSGIKVERLKDEG